MSSVVYLGEVLEVKVRIDLGRRDICVAQQFLDTAQVVARFEQVRGKGVPEQVRLLTNSACSSGPAMAARDARHFARASSAFEPTGTILSLLPLPVTRTVASCLSTSSTSRSVSSARRRPDE